MIIQERYTLNGVDFIRTISNDDRYVVRDGVPYVEANDPAEFNRQYTEGERMTDDEIAAQAEEVMGILLGVSE